MLPVQIAVLGDHFRLDPDTELDTFRVDSAHQLAKAATQLLFIDLPVSQTAVVVLAFAEPSVVQHHHVDTQSGRFSCQLHDRLPGKVKVSRLPAVHQHRPGHKSRLAAAISLHFCCAPAARSVAYMISDTTMIFHRQIPKSSVAVTHNRLRNLKRLSGFQRIMKKITLQSHQHTRLVKLILLRLTEKVPAVDKDHTVAVPGILRGVLLCHDDCRIILMTGSASAASDAVASMSDPYPLQIPFHRMSSVETEQVILSRDKIQTGRGRLLHNHTRCAVIGDLHASCNDILVFQYAVQQLHAHFAHVILQHDLKRLCFLLPGIHRRQSLKFILAFPDLISGIPQITTFRFVMTTQR